LDGAITAFRAALRINPNYAGAHFNLGTALGKKGDLDSESLAFRAGLRIDPNNAQEHSNLAWRSPKGQLGWRNQCIRAALSHES